MSAQVSSHVHGVPLPWHARIFAGAGAQRQVRAFVIVFAAYTSFVSIYKSGGDLPTMIFVASSLVLVAALWRQFRCLSLLDPVGRVALLHGDEIARPFVVTIQTASSRLCSTLEFLFTAVCSCIVTYSTVTGYIRSLGAAPTELFASCYLGFFAVYHYKHYIFVIFWGNLPVLLPIKARLQLVIWSAAIAFAMFVSSNSITLYLSNPGFLACDTLAFYMILVISGEFLQSALGPVETDEGRISNKWFVYHVLILNFIFRTTVLSSLPMELSVAVIIYSFVAFVTLWDVQNAGNLAMVDGSSVV